MDFLSAGTKKGDHCREVAVSGGSTVFHFLKAFYHRENESGAHVLFIEDEFVLSFFEKQVVDMEAP